MAADPNACPFCSLAHDEVLLAHNGDAILLNDRRPLMPGHLLIVSRDHIASFADATDGTRRHADDLQARAEEALLRTFGAAATYEHGRGPMCSSTGTGTGPIHAHRHVMPIDLDIAGTLVRRGWKDHRATQTPAPDLHYVEQSLRRRSLRRVVVATTAESHLIRRLVIDELRRAGSFAAHAPASAAIDDGTERIRQHLIVQSEPVEKGRGT